MAHMAHITQADMRPRCTLTCIPPHHHGAVFAPRDDILLAPESLMARNHPLPTSSEMPAQARNHPLPMSNEMPAQARNHPLPMSSEMPAQARNHPPPTSSEMPAHARNRPLPTWSGMPFQIGVPIRPAAPGQASVMAAAMRNRGPPLMKLAAFTHPGAWVPMSGGIGVQSFAVGDAATAHPAAWPDKAAARQRAALSPAALHDLWAQEAQQVFSQLISMSVRPPPHMAGVPAASVQPSPRASTHPASWPDGTGPHPKWRRRAARRLMAMRGDTASTHPAAWEPAPAMAEPRPPVGFYPTGWGGMPHSAAWPLEAAKKMETGPAPEKDTAAATTHHAAWPSEKVEAELPPSVEKRGLPLPAAAPTPRRLSLRRRLIWFEIMIALFVAAMFIFGMPEGSWSARPALAPALGVSVIDVPPIPPKRISACHDLLPTPAGTYTGRLQRLATALGDGRLDHDTPVWISEPGPSVEYFIGAFGAGVWSPSERPFLVAVTGTAEDVQVVLLTPAFEASRAHLIPLPNEVAEVATWLTWAESESPYTVLLQHLGNGRGLVLDGAVRTFIADGLRARGASVDRDAGRASAVTALRERKDEREIGLMRCANEFTLHAIRRTRAQMSLGIKESETRAILYAEMKALGLSDYGALVLFGENAALPHGRGTDRVLGETDLVLIDAGGRWGGYVADITRTFALPASRISDAHIEVWEIVRAAQRAPANLLSLVDVRDRVLLSWLDDRARETIKKGMAAWGVPPAKGAGPDYTVFTHRLGHGIGLEGHESPYAVQGPLGERELRTGNSFTFEPGVYIPADAKVGDDSVRGLGVRLEDVVVVRERKDGRWMVEWLTGPVQKWGDV